MVHVEVQSQKRPNFPERMFIYHYRLRDRYNRRVANLAVLGDEQASWRPDCYQDELLGCRLEFHFPTVKLLDYASRTEELEGCDNPFAVLVLAHIGSLKTSKKSESRYAWKFRLVKGLYQKGWSQERIRSLFRFIDWMLDLSAVLEERFTEELSQFEEKEQMPYVTSIERQGIKKGLEQGREEGREEGHGQGLVEGIESVLEIRFGEEAVSILSQIRQLSNVQVLEQVLQAAKTIDRPEDLAAVWSTHSDELRREET